LEWPAKNEFANMTDEQLNRQIRQLTAVVAAELG
jgi:hypothetical protein